MGATQSDVPRQPTQSHHSPRQLTWPWAAGSILAVLLVVGGTLAGRHVVSGARHAAAIVPSPAHPALNVAWLSSPTASIQLAALDADAGHVVALTSASMPECPPADGCPAAPAANAFVVLDGASGAILAQTPLAGAASAASRSIALLANATPHRAYAIAPQAVTVFSTLNGSPITSYSLTAETQGQPVVGAALDMQRQRLILATHNTLIVLDASNGHAVAQQGLTGPGQTADAPVVDERNGRIYVLERQDTPPTALLYAYDERTLATQGQFSLSNARLGPFDAASQTLYAYLPGGGVYGLPVGQIFATKANGQGSTLRDIPALQHATALGWDRARGYTFVATPTGVSVRESETSNEVAALPLGVAWSGTEPLLSDTRRGLLYLLTAQGTLVAVGVAPPAADMLTTSTATALARAAMATFLPDTNQDPPFVAPETFPLAAGTRTTKYWIHFSDLGWQGPYSGSASTQTQRESGSGAYLVSFTIKWYQLFWRSHTWVCEVQPNGSVQIHTQAGDAVP